MNAYKLVAIATAAVLTLASLGAIDYNVASQPAATPAVHVTELAPVHVHPSADELREMSALAAGVDPDTALASASRADTDEVSASFSLVGPALSVPHYSFGRKSGRVGKE